MFAIWLDILKQVPNSVLWLWNDNVDSKKNLRSWAARSRIAEERIVFAPSIPVADHLSRLKLADLFLDSLPYNAHTTASDALWAGVPLLTCVGSTFAGRVATSLLRAVGLDELISDSLESYVQKAVAISRGDELRFLREKLEHNRLRYPLFNTDRYRLHLERAYTTMWGRWRNGLGPESFHVPAIASDA